MAGLRGYGQWAPETEGVTLTWRDLSVYVPAEKEGGFFKRQNKPYKRLLNAGKMQQKLYFIFLAVSHCTTKLEINENYIESVIDFSIWRSKAWNIGRFDGLQVRNL